MVKCGRWVKAVPKKLFALSGKGLWEVEWGCEKICGVDLFGLCEMDNFCARGKLSQAERLNRHVPYLTCTYTREGRKNTHRPQPM